MLTKPDEAGGPMTLGTYVRIVLEADERAILVEGIQYGPQRTS